MRTLLYRYLKFWATGYLKRSKPEIIAITGSVGKTSTKEAIFEVLRVKYQTEVRKSAGNLNNESGVPVAILGFSDAPSFEAKNPLGWLPIILLAPWRSLLLKTAKILVLEFAADKPGDIKYLASFVRPKIAVLTAIGEAHLSQFGTVERIIEEKSNLLRALPSDGIAVLNIEDENVRKVSFGGKWQKKTYAIKQNADLRAKDIETKITDFQGETKFTIYENERELKVSQKTLGGFANVLSSLAAAAVGEIYELSAKEITEGLSKITTEKHRLQVVGGRKGAIIIDDCYNANPQSMAASLEILKSLKTPAKKYAVLGDMREIGTIKKRAHQEIGKMAREIADSVISVGVDAREYGADKHFASPKGAAENLLNRVQENDIILIKGSRAMHLEEIVSILKEKTNDQSC